MLVGHRRTVLRLYRRLLRLHQRLPDPDMRQIGRQFVREEFRKHKTAEPKFVANFMREWREYAELIEGQCVQQVDSERDAEELVLGRNFSTSELDLMNEQQLGQLLELQSETGKPRPKRTDDH